MAIVLPFFLLLLFGAVDLGRCYYLMLEVSGAAHAAAAYAVLSPTDATGIANAARLDAPDVTGLNVSTPSYGCECSDGTSFSANCMPSPTCTYNVVYRVSVTASATYKTLFPWPMVPSSFSLASTSVMRTGL
jgi:Flp pilus assembly protein TadG